MLYVASAQPATAQLDAFKCDFVDVGVDCLIINKLTRLEVYDVDTASEHLKLKLEIPLHSTIAAVVPIKLSTSTPASLVLLTTSQQLFALSYNPASSATYHVDTITTVSIAEPFGRLSEYQTIAVDPSLQCVVVLAYNGLLRVVPLRETESKSGRRGSKSASSASALAQPSLDFSRSYNIRLPTLNITSLAFLRPASPSAAEEVVELQPAIAFIYTNHLGRPTLASHHLRLADKELGEEEDGRLEAKSLDDPGSETLIPVSGVEDNEGGAIVIGEESLTWIPLKSPDSSPSKSKGKARAGDRTVIATKLPVGMIQAWAQIDKNEQEDDRFLLGDIYGKLLVVEVLRSSTGRVVDLVVQELGDAASPTALVQLAPRLLYLASRFGDSQLIRLPELSSVFSDARSNSIGASSGIEPRMDIDSESSIDLVHSYASLSPILDCVVVQGDRGASSQVVTCSGAYKGGSLRVVRQGVGLSELASVAVENAQHLWSLRCGADDDSVLALSFFHETRLLRFASNDDDTDDDDEGVEEIELEIFATDQPTIHACDSGSLVIQVLRGGVHYGVPGAPRSTWLPEGSRAITLGASCGEFILLALEGGQAVLLRRRDDTLETVGTTQFDAEIACLNVCMLNGRPVAVVALWTLNMLSILSLPDLAKLSAETLDTAFLIRSVLLVTFSADDNPTLFAGLGDGSLISFSLDRQSAAILADTQRTVAVGTQPISLCAYDQNGRTSVFVTCDRPTIVSQSNDRLVYSNVNLENITAVAPFSSAAYPSALALASAEGLRIGRAEDIQRVDIRAIPLDEEEPRRIAYDAQTDAFGVVCLRRDVDRQTGEQTTRGSIKLLKNKTFEVLASVALQAGEEGQSIACVRSGQSTYFVFGSAFVDTTESEPTRGRLIVLGEIESAESWEQLSELHTAGCPYALTECQSGFVAAAVNSEVIVYSLDAFSQALQPVASWGGAFVALNLVSGAGGQELIVGDALRSLTVLNFNSEPTPSLVEVARDYDAHYTSAVHQIGDDEFIGAETDLNLYTVLREKGSISRSIVHDETALTPRAVFHLGEMVSRFQPGSLMQHMGDGGGVAFPRLVYATSAGSIGVIAELDVKVSKLLSDLERNMRRVLENVGGLGQEEFRSFKSERRKAPPAGFVDGDFVERFEFLSEEQMQRVMEGGSEHERLTATVAEVRKAIEEAARLH